MLATTSSNCVSSFAPYLSILQRNIGVGAGKFLGVGRNLAQISPNFPETFLCAFCPQIFSHKNHEHLLVWCDLQKSHNMFFCNRWAPFFKSQTTLCAIFALIFRDFLECSDVLPKISGILPKFLTNQNFWGCACTPASYTTAAK